MWKQKYSFELSLMAGMAVGIGVVFVLFSHLLFQTHRVVTMPAAPQPVTEAVPEPTITPWSSPDGKKVLVMKMLKLTHESVKYSFFVTSDATATPSGQPIFSKVVSATTTMSIPFNTWSPDDQNFFIQEHTGNETHTYVLKASGQPFADGQVALDVETLFAQKNSNYGIKAITGWAAPTLLIVNTNSADPSQSAGNPGPSFWFDISRKTVIRLDHTFL